MSLRILFFFLAIFSFFASAHAFIAVPKADLIMDPFLEASFENTTSISSKPQITFFVLNNGTGIARVINSSLVTMQNHILLSAPAKVSPGYSSSFKYELTTLLCSENTSASFHFETWYYSTSNLSGVPKFLNSTNYSINISEFLSIEGITPSLEKLAVDIAKGTSMRFSVKNSGNQPVVYRINFTHPDTFSLRLGSSSIEYSEAEAEVLIFSIGASTTQVWSVGIVPLRMDTNQEFSVEVFSPECGFVRDNFTKSVDIVWVREGLVTQEIVPDITPLSVLFLLLISGFIFSKFYY